MINNPTEYQKMRDVEQKLWWYRSLHSRVVKQIQGHFKREKLELEILDAACGTGGLLLALENAGYTQVCGFDLSPMAVQLAQASGLDVQLGDLRRAQHFRAGHTYDVICCNDALYFLSAEEIIVFLTHMKARLKPGGIIFVNIHAFEVFSGTHDLAVGSSRRFTWSDFASYTQSAGLKLEYRTYWPFLLSLPILLVRQWQRYQLRRRLPSSEPVASDVAYPGPIVNATLWKVMQLESSLLRRSPFGSSLFMVLR